MKIDYRISRSILAWGSVAFAAIITLNANYLIDTALPLARADLTEEKLYTISDGTREVLAAIDEPIRMKVHFTRTFGDRYPRYAQHFDRLRTLLDQYRAMAGGRLIVEYSDPEPFSAAEERAVADGLRGVPISEQGDLGYFGVAAVNSVDERETIPFLNIDREHLLEYDLTSMIHNLARFDRTVVGLLSGLGLDGSVDPSHGVTQPWRIMDEIRHLFELEALSDINEIPTIEEIPPHIDILLLAQPLGLSDKTLYAIDQFVLGGGKAVLLADPYATLAAGIAYDEKLIPLLRAWGVEIDRETVVGDRKNARPVQISGSGQPVFTQYVLWPSLGPDNIDENDPAVAGLESLNLATAGSIDIVAGAESRVKPLVQTSDESMRIGTSDLGQNPDAVQLLREFLPSGEPLTVAVRIGGTGSSAFPSIGEADTEGGGETAVLPSGDSVAGTRHIASGEVNAIVIADIDMLHDRFWVSERDFFGQQMVTPSSGNAAFLINALENLSGQPSLIALRGRGVDDRPFELIRSVQLESERRYREQEQALSEELEKVETRLAEIEAAGSVVLMDEDRRLVEQFRARALEIRREMREVRLALRRDIDRLELWVKVVNIGGVPSALALVGLGIFGWRRLRQRVRQGGT